MAHRGGVLTRREWLLFLGSTPLVGVGLTGCGSDERVARADDSNPWAGLRLEASRFGRWRLEDGLPTFVYDADHETLPGVEWERFVLPPTKRHFMLIGNRALSLEVANDGTVALFDESEGLRWLVASEDAHGTAGSTPSDSAAGTGVSVVHDAGLDWAARSPSVRPGAYPSASLLPLGSRCARCTTG